MGFGALVGMCPSSTGTSVCEISDFECCLWATAAWCLNRQQRRPFTTACSMETPPKKPPQHRPQPKAQHYGQDPRLKRREANNLIGVGSLCLHLAGVLRALFGDFLSLLSGMKTSVLLCVTFSTFLADMIDLL